MDQFDHDDDIINIERRRDNSVILSELKHQRETLEGMARKLEETAALARKIAAGFPDDDPAGHRAYHEAVIRRIEARADFWRKMSFELAKWGIMSLLAWATVALWQAAIRGGKG